MSSRIQKNNSSDFVLKILTGSNKGKALRLLSSEIKIGRSSSCDLIFKEDILCANQHALLIKQEHAYLIQSLDSKFPVFVNKKPIQACVLKVKDEIQIGKVKMLFLQKQASLPVAPKTQKEKVLQPMRIVFVLILLSFGYLLLKDNTSPKTTESQKLNLKTEQETLKQVAELNKQTEDEALNSELNFKQESARIAFISGFRDYRKGYFKRALRMFKHCSTIDKSNPLCRRYELKSQSQIEKLIRNKMRVGNAHKEKKQYAACEATFRSVETMLEDTNSAIYKEAKAKRLACLVYLRNRI